MNAPEITKLTREEINTLFSLASTNRQLSKEECGQLESLGLIQGPGIYTITSAGRSRLKRERILRDREEKDAAVRRQELEAARAVEVAKERQQRIAAAQKKVIAAQKRRDADEEKLKARKKAEQLQIAA